MASVCIMREHLETGGVPGPLLDKIEMLYAPAVAAKGATPINWAAILQLFITYGLPVIEAVISGLVGIPALPTTPTK